MVPEFGAFDAKTPSPQDVYLFHNNSDRDSSPFAQHHTLGSKPNQAAPGNHKHDSYTTHDAGDIVWSISPNLKPGWAWPDGQSLLREDYPELFDEIGTTYGAVDADHFNLPLIKGKTLVALDAADASFNAIGDTGGAKTVTLTAAQSGLPAHNHQITIRANATGLGDWNVGFVNGTGSVGPMLTDNNAAQNAAQSHENMPPFFVGRLRICLGRI